VDTDCAHDGHGGDLSEWLFSLRNWNRWGPDDVRGTTNLISPAVILRGVAAVRHGRTVGLSREIPTVPGLDNPRPAQHFVRRKPRDGYEGAGSVGDYLAMEFHGLSTTHLDALGHVWDSRGAWNGMDPDAIIGLAHMEQGGVDIWKDGLVTRGVLFDVPGWRGVDYVTQERPVTGSDLRAMAADLDLPPQAGDAIVVYSGRERWSHDHGPWGAPPASEFGKPISGSHHRPGLHASVLPVLREWDCSLLLWDMMDMTPSGYDAPWAVHGALHSLGLPLVDNCLLEELVDASREVDQLDFLLVIAPLRLVGGTGSPVTPVAIL
jgi:kynurenine formamidase